MLHSRSTASIGGERGPAKRRGKSRRRGKNSIGTLLAVVALVASLFGPVDVNQADAQFGPFTPRNVRAENVTATGFGLAWDAPPSPVAYYRVYFEGALSEETPYLGTYFDGLIPETTYTVGVVGVTERGEISPQVTITVRTDDRSNIQVFFWQNEVRVSEGAGYFEAVIDNGARFGEFIVPGGVSVATRAGSATPGQDFYGSYAIENGIDGFNDVRFFQVDIIDDDVDEPDETFEIRLFNPTGGAVLVDDFQRYRTMRVTIVDNDEPAAEPVWVYLSTSLIGEGWNNELELVAVHSDRAPLPPNGFSLEVATVGESARPGSDYYGFYRVVEFPPGVDRIRIPITVLDDSLVERDETLRLQMWDASNDRVKFDRQGPVRIRSND